MRIWYSTGLGNNYVTLPDVVGMTAEEAQRMLLARKLRSVVMGADARNAGSRLIIKQDKQPGTRLKEGTEIRLTIEKIEGDQ